MGLKAFTIFSPFTHLAEHANCGSGCGSFVRPLTLGLMATLLYLAQNCNLSSGGLNISAVPAKKITLLLERSIPLNSYMDTSSKHKDPF